MTRRTFFRPGFVALTGFFQMREEVLVAHHLAKLRDNWLDAFPDAEELATRFEEEVFVEKAIIE